MAFNIAQEDVAARLASAIDRKNQRTETPVNNLGYIGSSPDKGSDQRFAGDLLAGNLGMNGPFGTMIQSPEGQKAVGGWAQYFSNGPYGPDAGYV